jgi:tetratricopeptide (TPR) repeat protein
MLGFAWLALRQAEDALKAGRLEEAHRLLGQPAAQGHKNSWELMTQVARGFVERGRQRVKHNDLESAWHDLLQAEQLGRSESDAGQLRKDLVEAGLLEARTYLRAGEPGKAVELLAQLRDRGVRLPESNLMEEAAKNWSHARDQASQGEFAQALDTLERVRGLLREPNPPLERLSDEMSQRHRTFSALLPRLHEAVNGKQWREAMEVAEQILAVAPRHAQARQTRSMAWKSVEPATVAAVEPVVERAPAAKAMERKEPAQRFLLWVDGVGGFLICLANRVTIGQATPETFVDVPLFADVSRLHASLTRDEEGYLLEGVRSVQVNGKRVERALLQANDRITLGTSCQFHFRQPAPVSASARLDLVSGHRLPLALDGVLLMADTLLLGEGSLTHVALPSVRPPVVLYRHKEGLAVRYGGKLTIDGRSAREREVLRPGSTVRGEEFAFTLEPAGARLVGA